MHRAGPLQGGLQGRKERENFLGVMTDFVGRGTLIPLTHLGEEEFWVLIHFVGDKGPGDRRTEGQRETFSDNL